MSEAKPLEGKRIVLTRAVEQARDLKARLESMGATVLLFPQNPMVLTPRLMTWLHQLRSDDMINAALLMMMAVVVPALAAVVLSGIGMRVTALRAKTRR